MLNRIAAFIGNFFEHYDHALFGFLSPFLAPLFFPETEPIVALIYTFAMLPLGILSKPLGAIVFGRLGDRIGRKRTFSFTLMGMAVVTGAMGFIPLFQDASTPFVWGSFRLLQGFFAAGETTGGAIYVLEKLKEEKRCFWGSLFDASGILGILAASGAVSLAFYWKISYCWLFWAGSLTGAIGAFVHLSADEPWIKKESSKTFRSLWAHKKPLAEIALVAGFSYANYYLLATFMNGFLPLAGIISKTEAIEMNTLLLIGDLILLPLFGFLGEKIGKEKLMIGALILASIAIVPLFSLAEEANYFSALTIRMSLTCIGVALAAPYHAWAIERAPKEHRYLIGAVGATIGSRLIGAPAPAISLWLYQKTGLAEMAATPTLIMALLALFALVPKPILKIAVTKK
jgi:MHS family proline/betaine transporter-like MFS transporter